MWIDIKEPAFCMVIITHFYDFFGRDAWGFGALDPNSGTAQMMEVVRVLAEKKATGWRPRRTMMFLSWGAEEYSLCGSREFVEQYEMEISDRQGLIGFMSSGEGGIF